MAELDEMVREFLIESAENLEQLDRELLQLEANPRDLQTVNVIFRIIHTIKGTCGFFDFKTLESVSHVGENLLDSIRSGRIVATDEVVTALLKLTDTIKALLANVAETGAEGNVDCSELVVWLSYLNEGESTPLETHPSTPHSTGYAEGEEEYSETTSSTVVAEDDSLEALFEAERSAYDQAQSTSLESSAVHNIPVHKIPTHNPLASGTPLHSEHHLAIKEEDQVETKTHGANKKSQDAEVEVKRTEVVDTTLRVDIGLLDTLMNLVGELVLARNQILQFTKSQRDGDFVSTSQRLNLITSELQEGVMRTRMQPISTVWNKLPRIVRDIAHACEKEVTLETQGKETELDKTIIEAIKDPLTHIIRNAVDHGIEKPSDRMTKGKPSGGTLLMRAFHEGGQVVIEISDDGGGLNSQRIKAKAVEKGLIPPDRADLMTDADICRLIFLPGFSTAEKVTNLSGRGVGMDVVRSNIERIGGTVDVTSIQGRGTTFTIRIPLTLAIIPALIVTAGPNQYAIPQVNLLELLRLEDSSNGSGLERIAGSDFYRLRGKLLPLVYLRKELRVDSNKMSDYEDTAMNIVVVRADHHQFGLVVDAIHDTEEIVVKPLGRHLKGISAFAGATIMGDGTVSLILDVVGVGRNAGITRKEAGLKQTKSNEPAQSTTNGKKLLVFTLSKKQRAAIPLEQVYRLEEFKSSAIEYTSSGLVIQYRDGILPLIDMRQELFGEQLEMREIVKAFVYRCGDSLVGFVVNEIVDIVEQDVKIERAAKQIGIVGSAIVQQQVTDIIDPGRLLEKAYSSSTSTHAVTQSPSL